MDKNKSVFQDSRETCRRLVLKNQKLMEDNRRLARTITKYRESQLLCMRRQLWEIENAAGYVEFFHSCGKPLQIFMGMERAVYMEKRTEELLVEMTGLPVQHAVRKYGGSFRGGKLLLPQPGPEFDLDSAREEIKTLSMIQVRDYLDVTEKKVSSGRMVWNERKLIQELGGIFEILQSFAAGGCPALPRLQSLAKQTRETFEDNGIYPMYREDRRLEGFPQLLQRFIISGDFPEEYPGLFIEKEDGWEVLGSYVGKAKPTRTDNRRNFS